jgi:hypothetical protein
MPSHPASASLGRTFAIQAIVYCQIHPLRPFGPPPPSRGRRARGTWHHSLPSMGRVPSGARRAGCKTTPYAIASLPTGEAGGSG